MKIRPSAGGKVAHESRRSSAVYTDVKIEMSVWLLDATTGRWVLTGQEQIVRPIEDVRPVELVPRMLKGFRARRAVARLRHLDREERDAEIGRRALQLVRQSDELADLSTEQLAARLVESHWRRDWGEPIAASTVARVLREQRVPSQRRALKRPRK